MALVIKPECRYTIVFRVNETEIENVFFYRPINMHLTVSAEKTVIKTNQSLHIDQ